MPLSPALQMNGKWQFLAILLAITVGSPAVMATGSENQPGSAPECFQSPTVACVLAVAIETAEAIDDAVRRADAFVRIAKVQRMAGDEGGAQESLSRVLAASAKVAMPSITVAWPYATGEDDWAQEGYLRALAAADKVEDDRAKAGMLADIADAQVLAGALRNAAETALVAREIYARLDDAGDVDVSSYLRRLAKVQARAGNLEAAFITADLMGNATSLERAIALADIAHAQATAGHPASAFAIERRVEGAYLRMIVVKEVGLALAASGDLAGAAKAAARITEIDEQEMWDPVYIEAEIMRSAIFQAIAEAHIAGGALDKAVVTLEKIERAYPYVDSAIAVAKAQMAAGELDDARMTADWICQTRHRNDRCVEALSNLALAHADAGNIEQAREFVSLAWKETDWTTFRHERVRGFVALSEAQTRMGDAAGGRKAFAEALADAIGIDYVRDRVEALTALGETAARIGEHDSAEKAFSAALAAASENEASWSGLAEDILRQRAVAFFGAGEARARDGDISGAREVFSLALVNAQVVHDHRWRVLLFRDIASALNSARDGALQSDNDPQRACPAWSWGT